MDDTRRISPAPGHYPPRRGTAGWLALLAGLSTAFTLVGSLVPFEFRLRSPGEVIDSFAWAMANRVAVQSRSDGVANVLLGVPLGFALFGLACVDRALSRRRVVGRMLAVLVACTAFAAAVELAQLYAPARTCCASDVIAQGLGATLGMALWAAFGQRLTDRFRAAAAGGGAVGHFLGAYLVLLGFSQALPLDLSLSPYAVQRKFRDGGVTLIPFRELRTTAADEWQVRAVALAGQAAMYLPVGLLAGCLPGRSRSADRVGRVALAAFGLAFVLELVQVLVQSRTASTTDVVVGTAAVLVGRFVVRSRAGRWLSGVGVGAWAAASVSRRGLAGRGHDD
jgi:VanZ family protein